LSFANLQAIHHKDISSLSGGQRQRLVLAGAILQSAELLVLDEPTQSLDISGQQEFYELLEKIRFSLGATIFIISHDLFTVMKNSDQVLCLNHHICCKGTPTHTIIKGIDGVSFYSHHHDHKH
jgi:zinc transport system ATP-binding protein